MPDHSTNPDNPREISPLEIRSSSCVSQRHSGAPFVRYARLAVATGQMDYDAIQTIRESFLAMAFLTSKRRDCITATRNLRCESKKWSENVERLSRIAYLRNTVHQGETTEMIVGTVSGIDRTHSPLENISQFRQEEQQFRYDPTKAEFSSDSPPSFDQGKLDLMEEASEAVALKEVQGIISDLGVVTLPPFPVPDHLDAFLTSIRAPTMDNVMVNSIILKVGTEFRYIAEEDAGYIH